MSYLLALDQGTTSSRAIVFDETGAVRAIEQTEFRQIYPRSGWVEHDAEEIWRTQRDVAEAVLKKAGVDVTEVAGVGITSQRETVVVWDRRSGVPIANAIVWQDRRTASTCDRLRDEGREPWLTQKTGLIFDPYFSATKLAWLLDNTPGAREQAEGGKLAAGTIDSWLIYRLTGGARHVTDATNASRTLLMDIQRGGWDDELLECFHVPRGVLPEIVASSGEIAEISIDSPLRGLRIAGVAGDQQAALFGQGCYEPGLVKNTYGTGCFALMNTGVEAAASKNRLLTTIASRIGERTEYALEGSVFTGGAVVKWLRDGLGLIDQAADIEALAGSVSDSNGVYFVPAFAGLGAPHWDAYARGAIVGLTGGATSAHLARAALDSIALQSADLVDAIHADSDAKVEQLRVDGGACINDLLMQRQADLLQVPVVRPKVTETTALGAAYLAGLATNVWPDRETVAQHWQIERRFEPTISADQAAEVRTTWRRAVQRALGWEQDSAKS
ncbi:MAG: glycerol kinase GlpK [Planctomycetota bacterium]